MTPLVALQRKNNVDPRLIKLSAEIRAAGFDIGSLRYSRDWPGSGPFHLRPTIMPNDCHATTLKLAKRGFRYHEWCQDLARRYTSLLEEVWNGTNGLPLSIPRRSDS